jgi:CHAT domain-containing protein
MDKREAFKAAQSQLREKHPQPYYWAAFVLID